MCFGEDLEREGERNCPKNAPKCLGGLEMFILLNTAPEAQRPFKVHRVEYTNSAISPFSRLTLI